LRWEGAGIWESHLRVELDPREGLTVTPFEGAIATRNGHALAPEPSPIRSGDEITIGEAQVEFALAPAIQRSMATWEIALWVLLADVVAAQLFLGGGLLGRLPGTVCLPQTGDVHHDPPAMEVSGFLSLFILLALGGLSFLCALSEAALFSLGRWQVRQLAGAAGQRAARLLEHPEDLLSALSLGSTLANGMLVVSALLLAEAYDWN